MEKRLKILIFRTSIVFYLLASIIQNSVEGSENDKIGEFLAFDFSYFKTFENGCQHDTILQLKKIQKDDYKKFYNRAAQLGIIRKKHSSDYATSSISSTTLVPCYDFDKIVFDSIKGRIPDEVSIEIECILNTFNQFTPKSERDLVILNEYLAPLCTKKMLKKLHRLKATPIYLHDMIKTRTAGLRCSIGYPGQEKAGVFLVENDAMIDVSGQTVLEIKKGRLPGDNSSKIHLILNPEITIFENSKYCVAKRKNMAYVALLQGAAIIQDGKDYYILGPNMIFAMGQGMFRNIAPVIASLDSCPDLKDYIEFRDEQNFRFSDELRTIRRLKRSSQFAMVNMDKSSRDSHKPTVTPLGTLSFKITLP